LALARSPWDTLMFSDQLFSDSFQNHSSSGTAICVGCLSIKRLA
jgi:hypothetical protein